MAPDAKKGWGYGSSRRHRSDSRGGPASGRSPRRRGQSRRRDHRSRTRTRDGGGRRRARSDDDSRRGGSGRRPEARNALTYDGRDERRRPGRPQTGKAARSPSVSVCSESAAAPTQSDAETSEYTYESSDGSDADGDDALEKALAKQKAQKAAGKKDEIVHFAWHAGMLLRSRYRVKKLLGDGTFGRVLLCEDKKKHCEVALKVIRSVEKYIRNAKREAEILKDISNADAKKAAGCVRMFETFSHEQEGQRFFVMTFEVLGASLYDVLKGNRFRGFWVQDVQSIAQQCLDALAFLHDELNLTHTDLKLENVLFESTAPLQRADFPREKEWLEASRRSQTDRSTPYTRPADARIKLIDFGNATYELEHHSSVINTRQYRAPEVILSCGWNERSDLWSIGCIIMEIYTGDLLFRTHESIEHLALMEKAIEPFPGAMFEAASEAKKEQFLTRCRNSLGWQLMWPDGASSPASKLHVDGQPTLRTLVPERHRALSDFASSLLILDPERRPTAAAALMHPFLYDRFKD